MMALEEALRFVSSIFRCPPIQEEFLQLPPNDSDALMNLAARKGFRLTPSELLVVMEWTSRYLKRGEDPMDDTLATLLNTYSPS